MAEQNQNLDQQLSKLRIDRSRKKPRRGGRVWKWAVFILLAAAMGCGVYMKLNAPVLVRAAVAGRESVEAGKGAAVVTATGYVIPRRKIEVSAKIIGRVREIPVERGDKVNAGDILLRIEDEEYQARLQSAEAGCAVLRARLAELKAGSRAQEIEAANAALEAAEATLRSTKNDFEKIESMTRDGIVSKQELDRARAALDVAAADLKSAQKNAELVKIGPRAEVIQAAEAQLSEAEANLSLAKTELENTVIKAPITGTILEKVAEAGELVTNTNFGGTRGAKSSVVSMADLTDLQVEVDINQSDLAKVGRGQKAEIRLDSNLERVYAGEVDDISPQADRQKGTVQTKVRVLDPDESMRTEVNARVTFLEDAPASAPEAAGATRVLIPKSAVVQEADGPHVYIVAAGRAKKQDVKLGIGTEKDVEVTEGLAGGEKVILSPLDKVTDGARVELGD